MTDDSIRAPWQEPNSDAPGLCSMRSGSFRRGCIAGMRTRGISADSGFKKSISVSFYEYVS
jgi:hypothetical protein